MNLRPVELLRQARELTRTKKLASLPELAWNCVRDNWPWTGAAPRLPRALLIYATYRCNARCRMCGIWQDHEFTDAQSELSLAELDAILADRLFANIEYLNLNGGEPALRSDLAELVRLCLDRLPRLKHLSLNSNGLLTQRLVGAVGPIVAECQRRNLPFSLVISRHATDQRLDEILGVPGASGRQQVTLAALQGLEGAAALSLSLNCVISNLNAAHLDELQAWCQAHGLRINFIMGEVRDRFFNQAMRAQTVVSGANKQQAIAFLKRLARDRSLANPAAYRYDQLAGMLERGAPRRMACHYAMGGLILGSHGDLYYCSHSQAIGNCRQRPAHAIYFDSANLHYRHTRLLGAECAYCPPNTFNRLEFQKDLARFVAFLFRPGASAAADAGASTEAKEATS